jgi:hypothetical protein
VFEEEDKETGYAVFLAVTLAIVVSLFVIALAIGQTVGLSGGKPGRAMAAPGMLKVIGLVEFDAGKADPPDDLPMLLNPSLRAALALPTSKLVVAAYYRGGDAGGEALAKQRAAVVRDALVASGVKASRIVVASPAVGGDSVEETQRVELSLR